MNFKGMAVHEYSIAEGIVSAIKKLKDANNLISISEAVIQIGSLAQIDRNVLLDLLSILSEEYGLGKVNYIIKYEESSFECNQCGFTWSWSHVKESIMGELCGELKDCDNPVHFIPDLINVFMKCLRCGSQDFKIVSGYDVRLISVKGVRND